MTQDFYISVTPIGGKDYLIRTERVAPGVPLAEEQVTWPMEAWMGQAQQLMHDPLLGLLRGNHVSAFNHRSYRSGTAAQSQPSPSLVSFGQQLYNALFQGTIRDSWMTAQGIAQHRREVLRLRLGLKGEDLPRLPWEVLHRGDRPLSTGTDVVFSRYQAAFSPMTAVFHPLRPQGVGTRQPLRILMVLSAPTDQEVLELRQEALHLKAELQEEAIGGGFPNIQLTILEQPGREQLTQALEQGHYQIFHYAGHSNLGQSGGDVYLVSDKTGLTEVISGDDLAGLLVNNGICMAVFNSCRGVYTAAEAEPGDGNLAEALLRRGIPGVLAMAERIPDDVALTFSRLFYRNLKQIYPIDLSLNRARQGLISAYGSHQLYWALPILYLHPEFDGYLQAPPQQGNSQGDNLIERLAQEDRGWASNLSQTPIFDDEADGDLLDLYPQSEDEDLDGLVEELEYDDPDYSSDLAAVSGLLQELTKPTDADEPAPGQVDPSPFSSNVPGNPAYRTPNPATKPALSVANASDGGQKENQTPAELAQAYNQLGASLYQKGDVVAAITAYRRAIQLQPTLAEAYNSLGMALYQQGHLAEARAVYQQAMQVNPQMADVYKNLERLMATQSQLDEALKQKEQSQPATATATPPVADPPPADSNSIAAEPTPAPPVESPQPRWNWLTLPALPRLRWPVVAGVGVVAAIVIGGGLLVNRWLSPPEQPGDLLNPSTLPLSPGPTLSQGDPAKTDTASLTALATEKFAQGDLRLAQEAVAALLDRNALPQADAALSSVAQTDVDKPAIAFLKGRLAWQSIKVNNPNYSYTDVRRFWRSAIKGQPDDPAYYNALGFLYYTEGNLSQASDTWFKALYTAQERQSASPSPQIAQEMLVSYAGIALASMKSAPGQKDPKQRALLNREAIKLRQKVLLEEGTRFQPQALAQNWLWTEKAIADWEKLLALK